MPLSQTDFLSRVDAFNNESPEAIAFFTSTFHLENEDALELVFRFASKQHSEFVLGYVGWAHRERIAELSLPNKAGHNLTVNLPDELNSCKKLCHILSSNIADRPLVWQRKLAQILVRRCIVLYRSNPTVAIRAIQLVMAWTKVTLSMLKLAVQTQERNLIMPLFASWANRIQLRNQTPLKFCPEAQKLSLGFVPYISVQDWELVSQKLELVGSNELLLEAARADNVGLSDYLLDKGFPRNLEKEEELYAHQFLATPLPKHSLAAFCNNLYLQKRSWLCKLLFDQNRLDVVVALASQWNHSDLRFIEDCILHQAKCIDSAAWLAMAHNSGLLDWMSQEASSFFIREINRLVRSNNRLSKYF